MESGDDCTYWDSRVSQEDMEDMWRNPDVLEEWTKSGERRGSVRFSQDVERRLYLSRVEVLVRKIRCIQILETFLELYLNVGN